MATAVRAAAIRVCPEPSGCAIEPEESSTITIPALVKDGSADACGTVGSVRSSPPISVAAVLRRRRAMSHFPLCPRPAFANAT
ncbi:hypothetical protein GCM10010361_36780 [Streptomyces olivaceiscleroticus]|uniref:Uncharacterized protein n=1 Tax=Streptomyces olivaceiscleroticus TaxID=68245 RepID=A0ABN1A756_9ACTN